MNVPVSWQPERYQPLLQVLAWQLALDPRLEGRLDTAALVAATLQNAQHPPGQASEGDRVVWLMQILRGRLVSQLRQTLPSFDVALERALVEHLRETARLLQARLTDWQAASAGRMLRIFEAVGQLAADERDAILLRYPLGQTVPQMATVLHRSDRDVADLLRRALTRLHTLLADLDPRS